MPMYAISISSSIGDMIGRHDAVVAAGGTCVMVSAKWVGFAGVEHLRRRTQVPIYAHRNGWGAGFVDLPVSAVELRRAG